MSLDTARTELLGRLEHNSGADFRNLVLSDWPGARQLIIEWFDSYKQWEFSDSTEAAFNEQRMSIRWANQGLDSSFPSIRAKPAGVDADSKEYRRADGRTFGSNVGMAGVLQRMKDPSIFVPQQPLAASSKSEKGLHDLSASILKKGKRITSAAP